jgi:hypothetical protein
MTDAQAERSQEPVGLAEGVQVLEALVAQQAEVIAKLQAENPAAAGGGRRAAPSAWADFQDLAPAAVIRRAAQAASARASSRAGSASTRQAAREPWGDLDAVKSRTPWLVFLIQRV